MSEFASCTSGSALLKASDAGMAAPDAEHVDAAKRVISNPHAVELHGVWLDGTFPLYAEGSSLAEELLVGADKIGRYCGKNRRAIFHLIHSSQFFPWFRIGSRVCSTRSAIDAWLKGQMQHHTPSGKPLRRELVPDPPKK